MSLLKPQIQFKVGEKTWILRFNLRASLALKEKYGIGMEELRAQCEVEKLDDDTATALLPKLIYAMTRSMGEAAPTEDEILDLEFADLDSAKCAVFGPHGVGMDPGALGNARAAAKRPAAAANSISGKRSRKAAPTLGSRRRRS